MKPKIHIERLWRDEEGAILVFFAVSLVVFLGLVALSFDFGRAASTQSELQSYADQVALAAAGELDGNSDAITRATEAAKLIADKQAFATGSPALGGGADYTLSFYSSLPNDDTTPMTAQPETTDATKAAFVQVKVNDRTVSTNFWNAFNALMGSKDRDIITQASAVAGFTQYACDITPLMFCLPKKDTNKKLLEGDMVVLRSGGQGAAWGPGNFGFLEPASGELSADPAGPCGGIKSGPQLLQCVLAAAGSVTQCFAQHGVNTEPGQKVGLTNTGLNVRFDMYTGSMKSEKNASDFEPAPNVIKGIVPKNGNCIGNTFNPSPDTIALPRDACIEDGSCVPFGDGDWSTDRIKYWKTNYGTGSDPYGDANTRYEYYKAEINANKNKPKSPILKGKAETGRPMCSSKQSDDPDRRTIIAAAIDCEDNPINGAAKGVPVKSYYKIFLTEPVGTDTSVSPQGFTIYGEIVGRVDVEGDANAIFHDFVQLYR